MPSLQTIFRAVVMVLVGMIAIKAWQLYGPTNEQAKTAITKLIDVVQQALHSRQQAASSDPDPRLAAPRVNDPNQLPAPVAATPVLAPQPAPLTQEAPKLLPQSGSPPAAASVGPLAGPAEKTSQASTGSGDRMPELMSRLEQLGAADTNLSPWGSGGKMYRFSCRAPLASAPTMTQHFESVAAEPIVAVEQVVAKVEAWRVQLRY
jgi:hypothetical protein